jgi:outer membrane lipoprotein-sorting protein
MKRKDLVIAISTGFFLGILMVVFQALGYLPQPLKVNAAGNAEEALSKALTSYKNWSSLQGEAQLVQYDADGNPHLDIVSVEIAQPLKANVAFKASDDKAKTDQRWVSDGKKTYQVNDGNLSYVESNIPGFAKNLDFIPQTLADVKRGEVYNYPFAMLISNPIMEYVYPVGFAQAPSGASYQLLGEENVAGRTTWKVVLQTKTDYSVAWIDQATGVILKYSQETSGQKVVEMEFVWIKIDQNIDVQEFSPPDMGKYHPVTNP